jgi:flagellar motor switch protein FliM
MGIQKVTVELSASLAKLRIRSADIASLQIGDILMTDQPPSGSVTLQMGDQNLCQSSVGTHQGRMALRLIQSPQYRSLPKDSDVRSTSR